MQRSLALGWKRIGRALAATALLCAAMATLLFDAAPFERLDRLLHERRQAAAMHVPSDQIVFVDLDARSTAELGPLPWPDDLMDAAVMRIRSYGPRLLVLPSSSTGVVKLLGDAESTASTAISLKGQKISIEAKSTMPSLAHALAASWGDRGTAIDYGIDAFALPRVSFVSVAEGKVDASLFRGRAVILSVTVGESRQTYAVPVHGHLSAVEIHALAAETEISGRTGRDLGMPFVGASALLLLALTAAMLWWNAPAVAAWFAFGALAWTAERVATAAYAQDGTFLPIGAVFALAGTCSVLVTFARIARARGQAAVATWEADRSKDVLDRIVEENVAGVVLLSRSGAVVHANEAARRLVASGQGGKPLTLPHYLARAARDAMVVEGWMDHPVRPAEVVEEDGGDRYLEYTLTPLSRYKAGTDREAAVAALTFADVSARERERRELKWHAEHDGLTGLKNRFAFLRSLDAAIGDQRAGVAFLIDIDGFRLLNETNGHGVGDAVLQEIAERIRAATHADDVVARLEGDRFALLTARKTLPEATELADLLAEAIARPMTFGAAEVTVEARTGVRPLGDDSSSNEVLSSLDFLLGEAKRRGVVVAIYDREAASRQERLRRIEAALPQAVANEEFSLVFQPQLDLKSGRISGAEALVRWRSPTLGDVLPDEFVPISERTGHVVAVGAWVLEEACRAALLWPAATTVAVNVSMRQIALSDLRAVVTAALGKTGLPAHRLEIELTESITPEGVDAYWTTVKALKSLGVRIALDDFGTGYAGLARLNERLFDKIKLDRTLVVDLERNAGARTILSTLADMAKALDLQTVVEGVESERQMAIVRATSCGAVQGYHVSRPLPAAPFLDFVTAFDGGRTMDQASSA